MSIGQAIVELHYEDSVMLAYVTGTTVTADKEFVIHTRNMPFGRESGHPVITSWSLGKDGLWYDGTLGIRITGRETIE